MAANHIFFQQKGWNENMPQEEKDELIAKFNKISKKKKASKAYVELQEQIKAEKERYRREKKMFDEHGYYYKELEVDQIYHTEEEKCCEKTKEAYEKTIDIIDNAANDDREEMIKALKGSDIMYVIGTLSINFQKLNIDKSTQAF